MSGFSIGLSTGSSVSLYNLMSSNNALNFLLSNIESEVHDPRLVPVLIKSIVGSPSLSLVQIGLTGRVFLWKTYT